MELCAVELDDNEILKEQHCTALHVMIRVDLMFVLEHSVDTIFIVWFMEILNITVKLQIFN